MDLTGALLVAGGLLAVATLIGLLLRRREGRHVDARPQEHVRASDLDGAGFGEAATLVQFSTEMCTRCPQVRRQLTGLAAHYWGVRHVEIDLTHRPDLARHYHVLQTPTTLLVDETGAVRARYRGAPDINALTDDLSTLATPEGANL